MKAKILMTAILFLLMTGLTTAAGFGTFTSEKDVSVSGGEASFSITVMNTGNQPLSVEFEPRNVEDAVVRFKDNEDSIILESSSPTRNPSSEGSWYYLGEGEYIETRKVEFKLLLQGSEYEEFSVDVRAQAITSDDENVNASQNIVQIRSYSYSVTSKRTDSNPSDEGEDEDPGVGFDFEGDDEGDFSGLPGIGLGDGPSDDSGPEDASDNGQDIEIDDGDNTDQQGNDSTDQVNEREGPNSSDDSSQEPQSGSLTGGFFQNQNINGVTVILMLGVMASAAYLYKVI
jgi:hypothetical protein